MRTILILIALLGFAVHPATAGTPIENGAKESGSGQKRIRPGRTSIFWRH